MTKKQLLESKLRKMVREVLNEGENQFPDIEKRLTSIVNFANTYIKFIHRDVFDESDLDNLIQKFSDILEDFKFHKKNWNA